MGYIYNGKARSLTIVIYQVIDGIEYEIEVSHTGLMAFSGFPAITEDDLARLSETDFILRRNAYYLFVMGLYPDIILPDDLTIEAEIDMEECLDLNPPSETTTEYEGEAPTYGSTQVIGILSGALDLTGIINTYSNTSLNKTEIIIPEGTCWSVFLPISKANNGADDVWIDIRLPGGTILSQVYSDYSYDTVESYYEFNLCSEVSPIFKYGSGGSYEAIEGVLIEGYSTCTEDGDCTGIEIDPLSINYEASVTSLRLSGVVVDWKKELIMEEQTNVNIKPTFNIAFSSSSPSTAWLYYAVNSGAWIEVKEWDTEITGTESITIPSWVATSSTLEIRLMIRVPAEDSIVRTLSASITGAESDPTVPIQVMSPYTFEIEYPFY